nr:PREDICTED: protein amnionless [Bemisia tabaci]
MLLKYLGYLSLLEMAVLYFPSGVGAEIKIWMRNTNFNNSLNWRPPRRPSDEDTVVFPYQMLLEVMLAKSVSLCQLVLPSFGFLVMPVDAVIEFSGLPCDPSKELIYNRDFYERWENPTNWLYFPRNKATPHSARIPCPFDDVIFPSNSTFAVRLPPIPTTVKSFIYNDKELSSQELRSFIGESPIGQSQFLLTSTSHNDMVVPTITGQGCQNPTGCSCGTERLMQLSCNAFSTWLCNVPHCRDPVRPAGHCCDICGAVLEFNYDPLKFKMSELDIILESFLSLVKNQKGVDLFYHSGKTDRNTIQAVLVEKGPYKGVITDALHHLKSQILNDQSLGLSIARLSLAGDPYDPEAIFTTFSSFLMIVLLVIVGYICFIVYDSNINFVQLFRSSNLSNFVRFENVTGEVELRYEVQPTFRKSFRNPLSSLLQTASGSEEQSEPELHVPEEPTISYNNLALENSESEPEQESGDVEMNEMAANKSEEKQLHDIDLS